MASVTPGVITFLAIAAGSFWVPVAMAAEIAVRELEPNSYELTLTHQTPLDEKVARAIIADAAKSICKELEPVLGKWRFESSEKIGGDATSSDSSAFRFVQNVTCLAGTKAKTVPRAPILKSAEESQRVREDINRRTELYFRQLATNRFDDVYSTMVAPTLGTDKATWLRDQQSFQTLAGELRSVSVTKITIYDNPAETPEPGLYVAADFNNSYQDVPFQCGYLMWYRPEGGEFGIIRMDIGHVTSEQLKSIPESQWPDIKQKLRCATP